MTQIKNINGITKDNCSCGDWLNHWNNFTHKPAVFCAEIRCTQMFGLAGAFVQEIMDDTNWYVVPLCEKHQVATEELTLINNITLVSSEREETCGE